MRILSIAIVALLAFAGALQAQIAAPMLNPATADSLKISLNRLNKPFNPAVLPWGGPSRVGAALLDMEIEEPGTGTIAEGDGFAAQVRLVGESFAFNAEIFSVSLDVPPTVVPGGSKIEVDSSSIGVAYQGGEVFSVGVGLEAYDLNFLGSTEEGSLPLLGATLRFGEIYFLGAAVGTETVKDVGGETDRSVVRVGAAVQSRDTDGGYHLEVFIDNSDSAIGTAGPDVIEEEVVGLTAELVFGGGWLIGLEVLNTDVTDPSDPTGLSDLEVKERIISLGWAGSEGLAVVLSIIEEEETEGDGTVRNFDSLFLGAAWLF